MTDEAREKPMKLPWNRSTSDPQLTFYLSISGALSEADAVEKPDQRNILITRPMVGVHKAFRMHRQSAASSFFASQLTSLCGVNGDRISDQLCFMGL